MVGDRGAGKTTLVRALCNKPVKAVESTAGIDTSILEFDDQPSESDVAMVVWDFGGREVRAH